MNSTETIEPTHAGTHSDFDAALRSFKTRKIAYGDFLFLIDEQLAAGISQSQMLDSLHESERSEPLPRDVLTAVLDRISTWPLPTQGVAPLGDAATVVLEGSAALSTPRSVVAVGDVLKARFKLVELVGRGGMSRVFKAIDSRRLEAGLADPHVAVKVLTLPFHEYFGSLAALQAEAQKLQNLAHPNIVRVFDCDRDGEIVFMTMEYLLGTSLMTDDQAVLDTSQRVAVIQAIAGALDYAHRNSIVHGDLKPKNVILTERREVKVIDFGIARWIPSPDPTAEGRVSPPRKAVFAATKTYASPQVLARQIPEPADDVYALACVAYQLLTGSHPFGSGGAARASRVPPPHLPGMTQPEYSALTQALAYERNERTATVREFIDQFTASAALPSRRYPVRYAIGIATVVLAAILGWFMSHRPVGPSAQPSFTAPPLVTPATVHSVPAPGTVIRDCPTCPIMTVLPAGRFLQGADAGTESSAELPRHSVTIAYPLAIASHEVTVGDFQDFVTATGRDMRGCETYDGEWRRHASASWKDPGFTQGATHPVTCVSWQDATAYADWLTTRSGHTYRLPSSSEWEYAARAGNESALPWGNALGHACVDANVADQTAAQHFPGWQAFPCSDGFVNTAPVGSFKANSFGLSDMMGNVAEWTQDCWNDDYAGAPADGSARQSGNCSERELRGGSWFSVPTNMTASYRSHFAADYRTSSVGFRLVRQVEP